MARYVVVRSDGLAVLCNCSVDDAKEILSKYWHMHMSARFRWLRQYGYVIYVNSRAFRKDMTGIYTPEEFYSKYESAVKKEISELKIVPYFPAVRERMISEMIVVLLKLSYFMSKKEIHTIKIERKKRNRDDRAVKLVAVSDEILRYNERKARRYICNNADVFEFSKSFWVLVTVGGSEYALVVKKDATDEEIFDCVAEIAERKPEVLERLRNLDCRLEDGQVKDKLAAILSAASLLSA